MILAQNHGLTTSTNKEALNIYPFITTQTTGIPAPKHENDGTNDAGNHCANANSHIFQAKAVAPPFSLLRRYGSHLVSWWCGPISGLCS